MCCPGYPYTLISIAWGLLLWENAYRSLEHGVIGLKAAWPLFPQVAIFALSAAAGSEVAPHTVPGLCQKQPADRDD